MNYTNTQIVQNQAFSSTSIPTEKNYSGSYNPVTAVEAYKDPLLVIENLTRYERDIFNYFHRAKTGYFDSNGTKYQVLYMTRETIAAFVGCSVKTVTRATDRLFELGLIGKVTRKGAKSCRYSINGIFLDPSLRLKLCDLLPALRPNKSVSLYLARGALSFNKDGKSLPHGFFIPNVPQLVTIEERNIYFKPSLTERLPNVRAREGWVGQEEKRAQEKLQFEQELFKSLGLDMTPDELMHTVPTGGSGGIFSKKDREKGDGVKSFQSLMEDIVRNSAPRETYKGRDGSLGDDVTDQCYELRYTEPPKTMSEAARRNRELLKRLGRG